MRSAARAASTKATIVPMTGMTMLTTAHTSAAIANGSTVALPPHPPAPPAPPAPVGSGSGPTGTALVSSGFQASGSRAAPSGHPRQHYRHTGHRSRCRASVGCAPWPLRRFPSPVTPQPTSCSSPIRSRSLIGMLLDQQVPMEWAFRGPSTLRDRLGALDAAAIAAMRPDDVEAVFREKPALHRYPGVDGASARTRSATHLVDEYDGDAGRDLDRASTTPQVLFDRICARCPGYGDEKAKIFLAILGKRLGVAPEGLGGVRRSVRRRQPALGRRHRLPRGPRSVRARGSRRRRPAKKSKQE